MALLPAVGRSSSSPRSRPSSSLSTTTTPPPIRKGCVLTRIKAAPPVIVPFIWAPLLVPGIKVCGILYTEYYSIELFYIFFEHYCFQWFRWTQIGNRLIVYAQLFITVLFIHTLFLFIYLILLYTWHLMIIRVRIVAIDIIIFGYTFKIYISLYDGK